MGLSIGRAKPAISLVHRDPTASGWPGASPAPEAEGLVCLEVAFRADEATGFVPEGLAIEAVSPQEASIRATGLRGPLRIESGEGHVRARSHVGRLHVEVTEDARIQVEGLRSPDFTLRGHGGRVLLTGLRIDEGSLGSIRTEGGDVAVGVLPEDAHVDFVLESVTGTVEADIGVRSRDGSRRLEGRVGRGGGRLSVETHSGRISLRSHEDLIRRREVHKALGSLWGAAVAAGICG